MPLWDNFARQAEALPTASPHGGDDFVAIYDASAGAAQRTAVRNLRSRELFTVPMFISLTAAPSTSIPSTPLRVFRTPYALTITSAVLHCITPPTAIFSVDIYAGGVSIFDGSTNLVNNNFSLGANAVRAEATSFNSLPTVAVADNTELRFFVRTTQTAIRMPQITLMGYRT
jgi:hypothetical protein